MENKPILTENEKIALRMAGDSTSRIMTMDGTTAEDVIEQRNIKKFNEEVDQYVERFEKHSTNLEKFSEQINNNIENIEIMPINTYLLVKPFEENPFQRIVKDSKSGLILDIGGAKPQYKSDTTGKIEEEEAFIIVGVIQSVGPECKWCAEGDTVMFTKPSMVPVPFYRQGLVLVPEQRIMVVINENVTERFNKIKENGRQ